MSAPLSDLLPAERQGEPLPPELAGIRESIVGAIASGVWRTDPPAVETEIAGVRTLRFGSGADAWCTVLHFHGGGFRIGCPDSVGGYAAELARSCGVEVICPAYRLAPENPFPAGLADAARVLEAIRAESARPIVLSGDSAGGGLAASLAVLCVARSIPIAGLVLHSPWLDLTVSSPSYALNAASDPLFSYAAATEASRLYLQGHDPRDPHVSPLLASLTGFPPTLVTVGTGEVLLADSLSFHGVLKKAGVAAVLGEIPGMDHVAVTRDLSLPGAAQALQMTQAFMTSLREPPAST